MHSLIAITGAVLSWITIILQFYLLMVNRTTPVAEAIIRFFSFYTILTNILVALCFTVLAIGGKDKQNFFSRQGTLAAIAVYITIVGLVYNLVLRSLWQPQGLQRVVDEMLHSVIPVLFVAWWFAFIPKIKLVWKDAFTWLLFPIVYLVYILLRGAVSGFYPYPFVNVTEIGYGRVLINSALIAGAFIFFSLLFIAAGKFKERKSVSV